MIDRKEDKISMRRQCGLLGFCRSVFHKGWNETESNQLGRDQQWVGLNYKNITAVSQSFPAEPEKLYLLGKAFGKWYTREKENDEKIAPAPFIAAAG